MKIVYSLFYGLSFLSLVLNTSLGEEQKYTLRYQFHKGDILCWDVEHHNHVRTTVSGSTQTADTVSYSEKVWRVKEVKPDGTATFEHLVKWVDMRQKLDGSSEVRYNSRTDAKPPMGFEDVAACVGVPLSVITMDNKGKILSRKRNNAKGSAVSDGAITIPLPDEPIEVGHVWTFPCDIDVPLETGGIKKIKTMQQFKLESVKTGVAAISVSTQILSPINDPAIEAKAAQSETAGTVHFDIDAGRIIGQQMDMDKHVVGFRGPTSSIHYVTRFIEKSINETATTVGNQTTNKR